MSSNRRYFRALALTIKELRGKRTQQQMAESAGLPTSTWCKIEQQHQKPRDATFATIANAFDLTPSELEQRALETALKETQNDAADMDIDLNGIPEPEAARLLAMVDLFAAIDENLSRLKSYARSLAKGLRERPSGVEIGPRLIVELDELAAALEGDPPRRHILRRRGLELVDPNVDAKRLHLAAAEEVVTRAVLHIGGDHEGLRTREEKYDLVATLELINDSLATTATCE